MTYRVGDKVKKVSGYDFPGEVRAVFTNTSGDVRFVVEHEYSVGMLHIFNAKQLEIQ